MRQRATGSQNWLRARRTRTRPCCAGGKRAPHVGIFRAAQRRANQPYRGCLSSFRFAALQFNVDCMGYWWRGGVIWAAPSMPPAGVTELVDRVRASARALELPVDSRAFVPHVTLALKAHCGYAPRFDALSWRVTDLRLMGSTRASSGAGYRTLARLRADR